MSKTFPIASLLALATLPTFADDVTVGDLRWAGPFPVPSPVMIDTTDVNAGAFAKSSLLDIHADLEAVENGVSRNDGIIPSDANSLSISLAGFTLTNSSFAKGTVKIEGTADYRLYVDGHQIKDGKLTLTPGTHNAVVKCIAEAGASDTLVIKVDAPKCQIGQAGANTKRLYDLNDVLHAKSYSANNISPDGRFLLTCTYQMNTAGKDTYRYFLRNLATGTQQQVSYYQWMPRTNKMLTTRKNDGTPGYTLLAIDPVTFAETELTTSLPDNRYTLSPTEDFVIYTKTADAPAEDKDVYEVITPDDRQPGWRTRSNLYRFDLKSGISTPLTFGHHNVWLNDISQDGRYALISKSVYDATKMRPVDFNTLFRLDLTTMQLDTLIVSDGFVSSASFSPDGKTVAVTGSPECLGGIGKNVAEGQTPSMYEYELYLLDLASLPKGGVSADHGYAGVTPLTKDFNPSIGSHEWSVADGNLYFAAEDKDCVNFFRYVAKTGKIEKIAIPEDVIGRFSLSNKGVIAYSAQSADNGDRLYTLNAKTLKSTLVEDLCGKDLANVDLGECHPYSWVNPEGDTICCMYYLPPQFDSTKKYPMIVNYYGGCSPTSRNFGGRYSKQAYSALGYVVLVVNPRGATGFGQKWAAMHVNTAGKHIADDIIGAVKAFTAQNSWVNAKKIGCIGASYGGFMTQYLQTQTDIFAAAVSHAGISDHTSYWGEGYWGYSYSQTSMANSYPWTRKDLYVDQSPLFNADKIHTPILFVHGTGDTNVPVGESIQMYTALKLLGRPTAMVLVEGENHWIIEMQKRIKWQNTIWAWFAKYLQDDDEWWEHMYSTKTL